MIQPPKIIAWEITRQCPLACRHCRGSAGPIDPKHELTTHQARKVLEGLAQYGRPMIILTGGEPLTRNDVYELAQYGCELGMRIVLASCGLGIDEQTVQKMLKAGIACLSISLDGATAQTHDSFRGVQGSFTAGINAIKLAQQAGLHVQVNTTISQLNVDELESILKLVKTLGVNTFNPFLLVPTGRAKALADQELTAPQYEKTLQWLAEQEDKQDIHIRVTCAPHYQRIRQEKGLQEKEAQNHRPQGGCLGGKTFAFISHTGHIQICGFLDISAGDLHETDFDFAPIWKQSPFLHAIRDIDAYKGKCGYCEYRTLCAGCRARAHALTGDYLQSEPFCVYQPQRSPHA